MMDLPYSFHDRQSPIADEVFFDHVAWMVPDMDAASAVFEKLGFCLTDYSVHGNRDPETGQRIPQGTANRLAMLKTGYIELLCKVDGVDAPVVDDLRARLGRYTGVHLLAFSHADADAAYERIKADGFRLQPMVHLRRDVEAADGSDAEVQFSVIRASFDEIPEGRIQVLTHHTPDLMWQDRYLARDNALKALVDAVVCVQDPAISASRMAKFLGKSVHAVDADEVHVMSERGGLRFVTRRRLGAYVPGFDPPTLPYTAAIGFMSGNMAKTRAFLAEAGVAVTETDTALVVAPEDALGTALMVYQS
ncbi:VOC family protein [Thalassospiraceae bacterium LMO-JJ14]|nr:VOC family protein [Thalassospiraceae bacterium LMO-JJ14]